MELQACEFRRSCVRLLELGLLLQAVGSTQVQGDPRSSPHRAVINVDSGVAPLRPHLAESLTEGPVLCGLNVLALQPEPCYAVGLI